MVRGDLYCNEGVTCCDANRMIFIFLLLYNFPFTSHADRIKMIDENFQDLGRVAVIRWG